jgi:hypothetical protein
MTGSWDAEPHIYSDDLPGPLGLWYDAVSKELVVALSKEDRLQRISANVSGINDEFSGFQDDMPLAYPNPFDDFINLKLSPSAMKSLRILLVSGEGRVVFSKEAGESTPVGPSGNCSLDLSECILKPNGVYWIWWSDGRKVAIYPLVHSR